MTDYSTIPDDLPLPVDDGASDHLLGISMPDIALIATTSERVNLSALGPGRTILYVYPLTGRPGVALPDGWDTIPGARGCTTEACDFRDHSDQLRSAGAEHVYGLSSQSQQHQSEAVHRLRLPFAMLSDEGHALSRALKLPTFEADGNQLYTRLTLIVRNGVVEHTFYPIYPPNTHAQQVLEWLLANPVVGATS